MASLKDKLKEKLLDAEALLLGNRITVLGELAFLYGNFVDSDYKIMGLILSSLGGFCIGATRLGTETFRTYIKTKEHIKKHNKLDQHFLEMGICKKLYCDRQGAYLAARDYGQSKAFKESVKENIGVIPNF
ncbi:MAG: hypothetical protein Q7S33_00605 [Nanoarchaeota archaeon]|nr:hypothetical protein [Nanoarchaeota archaeon]